VMHLPSPDLEALRRAPPLSHADGFRDL